MEGKRRSYRISKCLLTVHFTPWETTRELTADLIGALERDDRKKVRDLSEGALNELCFAAELPAVEKFVLHGREYARRRGGRIVYRLMGRCSSDGVIEVAYRTAARGQVKKPSAYLGTLLHEFMHHYDFHHLKIRSLHTSGFFARIRDLRAMLDAGEANGPASSASG